MKLKTAQTKDATDACKEALIRGGCETTTYSSQAFELRLGGDKPGEVYDLWFPNDGYLEGEFVRIYKGTVVGYKDNGDWDFSNRIILILV